MKKQDNVLYIFLHVMKCAGTTLREHILKNLRDDEILLVYRNEPPYLSKKGEIEKYIKSITKKQREKIKVLFGHRIYYNLDKLFPNRKIRYITFLRNPVDRSISHYNWDRMRYPTLPKYRRVIIFPKGKRDLSFKSWFGNWMGEIKKENMKMSNFMFRFLFRSFFDTPLKERDINQTSMEKIKKILDKFYFIGLAKNLEDFLFTYRKLGITKFLDNANVSEKYLAQKEIVEAKRFLLPELKFDKELYEYALKLNRKFKRKHISFYFSVFHVRTKKILYYFSLNLSKLYHRISSELSKLYHRISSELSKLYHYITRELYQFTLLEFYKFSAKLKHRSKLYTKFVKLMKDKTGIK